MRLDLAQDPAVMYCAAEMNTTESHVVGLLHALWSWASRNCCDGSVTGASLESIGRVIGAPELPPLLVKVGWLQVEDSGPLPLISFPNWERHNSQSAKQRALTALRMAKSRAAHSDATSVTKAQPEQEQEKIHAPALAHGPRSKKHMDQKTSRKPGRPPKAAAPRIRSPKQPSRVAVTRDACEPMACRLWRACKYQGDDGGNLWGVAALWEAGLGELSEADLASAARGAALNGKNKPAHFYACLSETLAKRGQDLRALLRKVQILPDWPKENPNHGLDLRSDK